MENNIKFRNHPSIILETSLRTVIAVLAVFIFNLISEIGEESVTGADIVLLAGVFVAVLVFMLGYQTFLWAKTYITIEEHTLIVERNTLNKKRNTIGLKTVSNVNLEQNLLEMLLGTCKVKLDTNSLSTADQTDVNIVLKKTEAENFRKLVLARAEGQVVEVTGETLSAEVSISSGENEQIEENTKKGEADNILIGDIGDLILHGLFSLRIINLVVIVALLFVSAVLYQEEGMPSIDVLVSITTFLAIFLWPTVKEFFKYLGFRIERKKDKVYLSYGFFKKVAYSVPVDKINGIKLTQTTIARIAKRYMVEIINVGMDDDENEANTFFLPYSKLETIQNQLHAMLPEFDGAIEIKEEKQPAVIWLLSLPWLLLYIAVTVMAYILISEYVPASDLENAILFAAVVILLWRIINKLARFLTRGIKVDEKFLKIVDGGFAKRMLFVKYDKIQYVTGRQCIIAKHFKIQKGTISLLASLKNRIHELPYFGENDMEQLKNHLL